jgi:hypothetical protein
MDYKYIFGRQTSKTKNLRKISCVTALWGKLSDAF